MYISHEDFAELLAEEISRCLKEKDDYDYSQDDDRKDYLESLAD